MFYAWKEFEHILKSLLNSFIPMKIFYKFLEYELKNVFRNKHSNSKMLNNTKHSIDVKRFKKISC